MGVCGGEIPGPDLAGGGGLGFGCAGSHFEGGLGCQWLIVHGHGSRSILLRFSRVSASLIAFMPQAMMAEDMRNVT